MNLRGLPGLILLAGIALLAIPSAVVFYTDWLWFEELGYQGVFLRTLNAKALVFTVTFALSFVFLFVNLRLARRALSRPQFVLGTTEDGKPIVLESKSVAGLLLPVALVVSIGLAFSSANNWLEWLSAVNAVPFGDVDVLFSRDIAFYVFQLPVMDLVRQQALVLTVLALGASGALYLLSGNVVLEPRYGVAFWPKLNFASTTRAHLSLLLALLFALMAWGTWLELPRTLLTGSATNVVFGASYTDVYARVPFLRVSLVVMALATLLSVWQAFAPQRWLLPVAVGAYFLISTAGGLYASFVQRFVVTPNEQTTELPFIVNNIAATRRAYALDRVEERELSGDAALTADDIIANAGTIENIRLWDHQPLLQTFGQIQEIRTYYDFVNVDNDRYTLDGKYRQVMLSLREINTESLPNRSWVNERLTFTHGYGLTLGPVNEVTTVGQPVLFVRDLPPVTTVDLKVDEPSIYYGERSSDYALVKTDQPEFHYPRGEDNVTTTYDGTGGVPIGGFFRRLLFAIRFGASDIVFTNQLNPESRIMFHRQIGERVRKVAPFLQYDSDPYAVIADGRLFWIQDAYTTTTNYPYATPFGARGINYIRNSVKVVIDAYHGSMSFFLAEPTDPIALTLDKIFPGLLKPMDEMPESLRSHVRYPEEIFRVQAAAFATFHMTNPQVFYNKEDQWQVPVIDDEGSSVPMQPYYTIMRLPGEEKTEFIQMLPFTPRLKDNLAAWMVARSDGEHYGRLFAFQFPKQKVVFGPRQIVARINQDQTISPQITLWNQQGSQVIQGTLLVIPIEESLLYVRPLYLRSSGGKIPELKRVIVAYQDQIVMAETLNQGLVQIFGRSVATALSPDRLEMSDSMMTPSLTERSPAPDLSISADLASLAAQANDHYERAAAAQRAGDWALYGEEMKKLGEVLAQMEKIKS
ncbi:MAG: UPF0182 family protein [Acidobacteria bacterium]|jgi:uncharacterized protein|nr:UPF0182 family protein [Acidobacteriota bacterium]